MGDRLVLRAGKLLESPVAQGVRRTLEPDRLLFGPGCVRRPGLLGGGEAFRGLSQPREEEESSADKLAGLEKSIFRNPELSHPVGTDLSQQDLYSGHTALKLSILAF